MDAPPVNSDEAAVIAGVEFRRAAIGEKKFGASFTVKSAAFVLDFQPTSFT